MIIMRVAWWRSDEDATSGRSAFMQRPWASRSHADMTLLLSSVIWYQPNGSDRPTLRLGRDRQYCQHPVD